MSDKSEWEKQLAAREKKIDDAFRSRFSWQFREFKQGDYKYKAEVSVGEGWHGLIKQMCQEVEDFFGVGMGYPDKGFTWTQIKSKFGTLRAYFQCKQKLTESGMQKLIDIISKYEQLSAVTCEQCGSGAQTQNAMGWLVTYCDRHFEETMKERKARFGNEE